MALVRRLLAALWRERRWWLAPLAVAVVLLVAVWLMAPPTPLGRFVYGPR